MKWLGIPLFTVLCRPDRFLIQQPSAAIEGGDVRRFHAAAPPEIGRALFTQYLLPFEVTSVLILIAIFGAIVLARKEIDDASCPRVPLSWYLLLSAILFALGVAGFLFRKNIITVFMSIELMLNAVNLSFVAFSYQFKQVDGHIFSFFVMVVAAAEAAVGLGIILTVFKNRADAADRRSRSHEKLTRCSTLAHSRLPARRLPPSMDLLGRRFRSRIVNADRVGSVCCVPLGR